MVPRLFFYLIIGALAFSWLDLAEGFFRHGAVIGFILAAAYLDTWMYRRKRGASGASNVVSLLGYRKAVGHLADGSAERRERRDLRLVFNSPVHEEAEKLAQLLRAEGMRPIVVSSRDRRNTMCFEIRLSKREAERAQPLVNWFRNRLGNSSH